MKSKRTTSVCSSSTRTSRDGIDEVDGSSSSDDDDDSSGDEKEPVNDTPVTFEYVHGVASPPLHYKLPKSAEPSHGNSGTTTTTITSQPAGGSRKSGKSSAKQSLNVNRKNHHQPAMDSTADSSSDESSTVVDSAKPSPFLKLLSKIREFFYNRNNWSVTKESIIICFGIMFLSVVVGCILQYLVVKAND